jgi:competence protein ComEA
MGRSSKRTGEGGFERRETGETALAGSGRAVPRSKVAARNRNDTGTEVPDGGEIKMKSIRHWASTVVASALILLALPAVSAGAEGVVNINSASVEQLMLLPRVGPSVAQRIVEFREQNGRFKQAVDLMLVKGIGEKTFELIEPYVAVSGETSLKEKVRAARKDGSAGNG